MISETKHSAFSPVLERNELMVRNLKSPARKQPDDIETVMIPGASDLDREFVYLDGGHAVSQRFEENRSCELC
jgi:hypothetical protein